MPPPSDPSDIIKIARLEFSQKDIRQLDMRALVNLILGATHGLVGRINIELLEPMAKWFNDKDFKDKFHLELEKDMPDWADYKRRQRRWTKAQKQLSAERLRLYWQEVLKRRQLRNAIPAIKSKNADLCKSSNTDLFKLGKNQINTGFLTQVLAPFSPVERKKSEIELEFRQAKDRPISMILPWKAILEAELIGKDHFKFIKLKTRLPTNKTSDKISKFQHLLQMENDGAITLAQARPLDEIIIRPKALPKNHEIQMTDRYGRRCKFDWLALPDADQNKVIDDALAGRIICKSVVSVH